MAGYVGYNQASDVGNAFGGVGDALGSAILRGAIMRQQQQDRQQQLMLEIARLRQEQENARSLQEYRGEEIGLRKKQEEREKTKLDIDKKKAEESAAESAIRRRFATAARTEGLPPSQYQFGDPHLAAGKEYDEQKRQADISEGMAFLSNDPSKAMEGIMRQNALRSLAGNPIINQLIATQMGFHNVPPGNLVFSPGADVVGQAPFRPPNPARPQAGQDLSANTALTEFVKLIGSEGGYQNRTNNPIAMKLEPIVNAMLSRMTGTNAPPATGQPITAVNPQTKQRIVSYDGGQTWQPAQ